MKLIKNSFLIILIITNILCNQTYCLSQKQQQEAINEIQNQQYLNMQLINSYHLKLINLIEPKLRIYLRELKDNSLLLLIYIEPQIKEVEIIDYQVNYINKINNKELMKIELNHDLSTRLLVELKDLYQNTPYQICIQAKLKFVCDSFNDTDDPNRNFYHLLNQYCKSVKDSERIASQNNSSSKHNDQTIIINNCIDNIVTQKSISLQALTSSLGALISLIMVMSCIYSIQTCRTGRTLKKLNFRKPFEV
jgi:hypothetical protein